MAMPRIGEGQLLVRVAYSGVSPGTESRCFAGKQAGAPPEGFVPGYQFVGQVMDTSVSSFKEGDWVMASGSESLPLPRMWGAHVSHAVVSADKAHRFDASGICLKSAAFAKVAAIARHGIMLSAMTPSESAAVVGLGMVGFFSALLLHARGQHFTAWDLSPERVELARAAGIRAFCTAGVPDLAARIAEEGPPDVLVDATGAPKLLNTLLRAGRELPWGVPGPKGLRLVVQGSYPGEISIDYDTAFTREVSLLFPRDNTSDDLRAVLDRMERGELRLPEGAVRTAAPREAQSVYETLSAATPLSTVFDWGNA